MRRILLAPALGLLTLALAACGSGGETPDPTSVSPTLSPTPIASTTPGAPATPSPVPTSSGNPATPTAAPTESPTAVPSPATPAPSPTTVPPTPTTAPPTAVPTATPSPTPYPAQNVTITGRPSTWSITRVDGGVGTVVTWTWSDTIHVHNLSVDGLLTADGPTKQGSRTLTFSTPGTYQFRCDAHADTMNGTVIIH